MRKGEILICEESVNNVFGMPLFEKGKEYIENSPLFQKIDTISKELAYGKEKQEMKETRIRHRKISAFKFKK